MEQGISWDITTAIDIQNMHIAQELFHRKCVYVVQKYEGKDHYIYAIFSNKDVAITYAKSAYEQVRSFRNVDNNYKVIMFLLDAIMDNQTVVFDTKNMFDSSDN
jgi:hypothetical protein